MTENNIHKFPDPLELHAQKIEAGIVRRDNGGKEWIEGIIDIAIELFAARKLHGKNNNAFGEWCKGRFGDNVLDPNDRGILAREGGDPDQMRLALEKSDSRSLRAIFPSPGGGSHSPVKTPSAGGPKLQEAIDACLAYEATHGKLPPANRHFDIGLPGITESTYDRAIRAIISGRELADTLGPLKPTKAQAHHIEMMVKLEVKAATEQLNASFEIEIQKRNKADIDRLFPTLEKLREDAKRNEKIYRELIAKNALFTEREVMDIIKACHPDDSATKEVRSRAFIAVNAKKFILMGKMQ